MNDLDLLMKRIDAALATGRVSERRIGKCSVNDGSLVADLRSGRELRRHTVGRVSAWLDLFERNPDAALGQSVPRDAANRPAA